MIYGTNSRKKEFDGKCIVAFIDILGFSNEIKSTWNNSAEELFKRMKKFTSIVNSNISKQIKKVRSEAERDTYYGCNIRTFSDSVIILYAFNGNPDKRRFLIGLYYTLYTASFAWRTALNLNFTVRGGIEYGDMRWDNNVILGPAFIKAYELESKIAISSRVIMGSEVFKKTYSAFVDGNHSARDIRLGRVYAHLKNLMKPYLFVDVDKHLTLSPHSLYKKESEKEQIVQTIMQMQNKCNDLKSKLKYAPLLDALKMGKTRFADSDFEIIKNTYATTKA